MQPQIYAQEEICGICNEAITNPICQDCLEKEVIHWLSIKKPELIKHIRGTKGLFLGFETAPVRCVICGKNMKVCAHCFAEEIHEAIAEHDAERAEDFKKVFNFELMHTEIPH